MDIAKPIIPMKLDDGHGLSFQCNFLGPVLGALSYCGWLVSIFDDTSSNNGIESQRDLYYYLGVWISTLTLEYRGSPGCNPGPAALVLVITFEF